MVRVLAIADEEVPAAGLRVAREAVDLVVVAGDLAADYIERVVVAAAVPAAYVPGNHDRGGSDPSGVTNVDGVICELAGVRIAGLGGSVSYNGGPNQYTQKQFAARAQELAQRAGGPIDLLLTHSPPAGLGDQPDPAHMGVQALRDLIAGLTPTWHLHGHIHPNGMAKADRRLGETTIRNVIPWSVVEVALHTSSPVGGRESWRVER